MKLSEAINKLEGLRAEHGDVELLEDTADGCLPVGFYVETVVNDEGKDPGTAVLVTAYGPDDC